jgi:hypothetical protein
MRLYHIEHSVGSGWTPEGEAKLFERLKKIGVPALSHLDLVEMTRAMAEENDPMKFSNPNWGMVREELDETRIGLTRIRQAA